MSQGLIPGGDRFAIVAAYYLVAAEYHSGQNSKGYRKLSQCVRMGLKLGPLTDRHNPEAREWMAALLWKRRREIRREW